jgi:transcriptional regulator with XRE-family HTH domain
MKAKMLRAARAALGLSRKDLAELSGVSVITIARVEDGRSSLYETIDKLFWAMPEVTFTESRDGFSMKYVSMPSKDDYLAALGPCGK